MKLTVSQGVLSATAETLEDIKTLQGLADKRPVGRTVGFSPIYKKECPICGKKIRHLELHLKRNHTKAIAASTMPTGFDL